jgi:hypothetical protein
MAPREAGGLRKRGRRTIMETNANGGEIPPKKPTFNLNPEILRDISLEGLDEIEVVVVKEKPLQSRVIEGVVIHVAGAGVVALIGIVLTVLLR